MDRWRPRKRDLVLVEWWDAFSLTPAVWRTAREFTEASKLRPAKCISVGWIVRQTKRVVVLAPHVSLDSTGPDISGDKTIPRGCIKRVQRLEEAGDDD